MSDLVRNIQRNLKAIEPVQRQHRRLSNAPLHAVKEYADNVNRLGMKHSSSSSFADNVYNEVQRAATNHSSRVGSRTRMNHESLPKCTSMRTMVKEESKDKRQTDNSTNMIAQRGGARGSSQKLLTEQNQANRDDS